MGEMKSIGLRFAKATQEELDMCGTLFGILSDIEEGSWPRGTDGKFEEDAPNWFDPDSAEDCQEVVKRLLHLMQGQYGGLRRVHAMAHLAAFNDVFDPAQDHLAWHPDLVPAIEAREARKKAAEIEKEGEAHAS